MIKLDDFNSEYHVNHIIEGTGAIPTYAEVKQAIASYGLHDNAGNYLLADGSVLHADTVLTTTQKANVRAIGACNNRWIACGGGFTTVPTMRWCTADTVAFDTGNGYFTDDSGNDTIGYRMRLGKAFTDGKMLTAKILRSAIANSQTYDYFTAANYCYEFDNSLYRVSTGDWYLAAPGEYQLWMDCPVVYTNWNNVTGGTLPGTSSWDGYWTSLQWSASFSWRAGADSSRFGNAYDGYLYYGFYVLPTTTL